MATLSVDLDGLTDLPPGKIAAVVTYLEMTSNPGPGSLARSDLALRRFPAPDLAWYRRLFFRVGEDWLWFSHAIITDAELTAILKRPATEIYALEQSGEPIGLAVLDRTATEVKISYFGVIGEATGTGAAQFMMQETLRAAWQPGIRRVWLHTCTIDHPAAIRFYLRQGFRAYKLAVEVADDPRLQGYLPRSAAPHMPLIEPTKGTGKKR